MQHAADESGRKAGIAKLQGNLSPFSRDGSNATETDVQTINDPWSEGENQRENGSHFDETLHGITHAPLKVI